MNPQIVRAIHERRRLQLRYGWGIRWVEPHAYGVTAEGHEVLRCYQIGGTSSSGRPVGWKLLRVDEITSLNVEEDTFPRPRFDYDPADPAMTRQIFAQL